MVPSGVFFMKLDSSLAPHITTTILPNHNTQNKDTHSYTNPVTLYQCLTSYVSSCNCDITAVNRVKKMVYITYIILTEKFQIISLVTLSCGTLGIRTLKAPVVGLTCMTSSCINDTYKLALISVHVNVDIIK